MQKLLVLLISLFASPLFAWTIGPEIGTLGYGVNSGFHITSRLGVRFAIHNGSYSQTIHEESLRYDGETRLDNAGGIVDFYPSDSGFRISGGLFANNNKIRLVSNEVRTFIINGNPYDAGLLGNITGEAKFNQVAPYLGVGWATKQLGPGWGLLVDAGVYYQGRPRIALSPHPIAGDTSRFPAMFRTDLSAEIANTERDMGREAYRPVIAVGVVFGF